MGFHGCPLTSTPKKACLNIIFFLQGPFPCQVPWQRKNEGTLKLTPPSWSQLVPAGWQVWLGTSDDWVGTTDRPSKEQGAGSVAVSRSVGPPLDPCNLLGSQQGMSPFGGSMLACRGVQLRTQE